MDSSLQTQLLFLQEQHLKEMAWIFSPFVNILFIPMSRVTILIINQRKKMHRYNVVVICHPVLSHPTRSDK